MTVTVDVEQFEAAVARIAGITERLTAVVGEMSEIARLLQAARDDTQEGTPDAAVA